MFSKNIKRERNQTEYLLNLSDDDDLISNNKSQKEKDTMDFFVDSIKDELDEEIHLENITSLLSEKRDPHIYVFASFHFFNDKPQDSSYIVSDQYNSSYDEAYNAMNIFRNNEENYNDESDDSISDSDSENDEEKYDSDNNKDKKNTNKKDQVNDKKVLVSYGVEKLKCTNPITKGIYIICHYNIKEGFGTVIDNLYDTYESAKLALQVILKKQGHSNYGSNINYFQPIGTNDRYRIEPICAGK